MEGDQMKMREALETLARTVRAFMATKGANFYPDIAIALEAANAALSAPPRQCDVGTAEEQSERWQAFCGKYDDDCTGCPCDGYTCSLAYCFAKWSQMPYEAEEGAEHGEA